MNLPKKNIFTVDWGRQFIKHIGGDPSPIGEKWCWREFCKEYGQNMELVQQVLQYFADNKSVIALTQITFYCPQYREWAEKVIEETGSVDFAYRMVRDAGSSAEWYTKVTGEKLEYHTYS